MTEVELGGCETTQPDLVELQSRIQESMDLSQKVFGDLEAAIVRMWGEQPESDAKVASGPRPVRSGTCGNLLDQADDLRGIIGNIAGAASRLSQVV